MRRMFLRFWLRNVLRLRRRRYVRLSVLVLRVRRVCVRRMLSVFVRRCRLSGPLVSPAFRRWDWEAISHHSLRTSQLIVLSLLRRSFVRRNAPILFRAHHCVPMHRVSVRLCRLAGPLAVPVYRHSGIILMRQRSHHTLLAIVEAHRKHSRRSLI